MGSNEKLSDAEFKQMLNLISRYASTEMDQWEAWKIDSSFSKIYVDISMKPESPGAEESYTDFSYLIVSLD